MYLRCLGQPHERLIIITKTLLTFPFKYFIVIAKGENAMYEIYFYKNRKGEQPVRDYIMSLDGKNGKDSRIKATKIRDYIKALSVYGLSLDTNYIKPIKNEENLWELRPLKDRIFFVTWNETGFVLLHHFQKKTQKTPKREIEQALREIEDLKQRGVNDEQ